MPDVVATLIATIGADVTGLRRGLREAEGGLEGLAGKLSGLGSSVTEFGLRLTGLTDPLRTAFGTGIRVASTYEDSMAEIGARSGATADQMAILNQRALELGAVMPGVTSQDVLQGFLELTTGGMAFDEALVALQPTMTGAVAGSQALADQANDLTDVMNIFGWSAEQAGAMVDFMAKAAGATSATMPELWDAVAAVGPVANQFGVDFYETSEVMGIFADAGIRGSEAGTQLRSMLLNMNRPTDDVKAAWEELGTSFYDANGNARGLEAVIEDLKVSLAGFSMQDQNELIKQLAGSYGAVALTTLLAAEPLSYIGGYIDESAGAADVAAAKTNTYSGSVETLQGSLETLATTVLTPFMDSVLKPLNEEFTKIVTAVTDWAAKNPEVASTIVGIGAAIAFGGPLIFGLGLSFQIVSGIVAVGGALVTGLAAVATGLWGVGGSLIALLGPIGLVIAGLTVLAGLLASLDYTPVRELQTEVVTAKDLVDDLAGSLAALGNNSIVIADTNAMTGFDTGTARGAQFFGPSPSANWATGPWQPPGNALGGRLGAGGAFLVGERGPEVFFPGETGYVAPIRMGAGGGGGAGAVNVNGPVNVYGVQDVEGFYDELARVAKRRNKAWE